MRSIWVSTIRFATVLFLAGMGWNRPAIAVPWDVFDDSNSNSICGADERARGGPMGRTSPDRPKIYPQS
jgi:hypothetical protein